MYLNFIHEITVEQNPTLKISKGEMVLCQEFNKTNHTFRIKQEQQQKITHIQYKAEDNDDDNLNSNLFFFLFVQLFFLIRFSMCFGLPAVLNPRRLL